eukprot:gene28925-32119_t
MGKGAESPEASPGGSRVQRAEDLGGADLPPVSLRTSTTLAGGVHGAQPHPPDRPRRQRPRPRPHTGPVLVTTTTWTLPKSRRTETSKHVQQKWQDNHVDPSWTPVPGLSQGQAYVLKGPHTASPPRARLHVWVQKKRQCTTVKDPWLLGPRPGCCVTWREAGPSLALPRTAESC